MMDISKLNTKDEQQAGSFLHLRHTKYDHELYTGPGADEYGRLVDRSQDHEKVGVWVRGYESKSIQDLVDRLQAKRMSDPKKMSLSKMGQTIACALVFKFSGLYKTTADGQTVPLENTDEDKMAFFEQSDILVDQVQAFAKDRTNFFDELPAA